MNNGKVVGGAILLAVAIWLFLTMSDATARYLGELYWEYWELH